MKKKSALRIVRAILAITVFSAFCVLFLSAGTAVGKALGFLPKLEFWPAVMALNFAVLAFWIVVTVLFGRLYCSVACPLGIFQDIVWSIRGWFSKRPRSSFRKPRNVLRYALLALFLALTFALDGAYSCLLEPYSIFGRAIAVPSPIVLGAVSLATVAAVALVALKWGREWCNSICPVGSLLSLLSRSSVFAPRISESECVSCGLCSLKCRAGCIDPKSHTVDTSRCIDCFECLDACAQGAIRFRPKSKAETAAAPVDGPSDPGRRAFLSTGALLAGAAISARAASFSGEPSGRKVERLTPIVPPGAQSIRNVASKCVGCMLCVSACKGKVLKPSLAPGRFLQPELQYSEGRYCLPDCTACSDVCPTGAIQPLGALLKSQVSIGRATIDERSCLTYTRDARCGICARRCTYGAIRMVDGHPQVDYSKCTGCGKCEMVCPAKAILVEGREKHKIFEK